MSGSCAEVWSVTMSGRRRGAGSGRFSAACRAARSRPLFRCWPTASAIIASAFRLRSRSRACAVDISRGCTGANRCAAAGASWRNAPAPAMVRGQGLRTGHTTETGGDDPAAAEIAAMMLAGLDEGFVGALHDAFGPDVDPRARRSSQQFVTRADELRLEMLPVHQCGTRLELAISTRGASAWVLNTPTGLPDCTRSVSSSSIAWALDDPVIGVPIQGGAAYAAIDHQLLGFSAASGSRLFISILGGRVGLPGRALSSLTRGLRVRGCCGGWQDDVGRPNFSL